MTKTRSSADNFFPVSKDYRIREGMEERGVPVLKADYPYMHSEIHDGVLVEYIRKDIAKSREDKLINIAMITTGFNELGEGVLKDIISDLYKQAKLLKL